jgi:hypothetical protein
MIFGGLEILAAKWLGGHITSALAGHLAHASAHTVGHFAYAAAHNVVGSAAASGSTTGALHTLGAGAKAGYKLTKMVVEARLAEERASEEEKLNAILFAIAMSLVEGYYASQQHLGTRGQPKTELSEMEPCGAAGCECKDFQHGGTMSTCKDCAHNSWQHDTITEEDADESSVEWLFLGMAAEIYPSLMNRNGEGQLKTELHQIDTCCESSCPCWDFDMSEANTFLSRRCTCGHRWREHVVTGQWHWIIQTLAFLVLQEALEEQ